MPSALRWPRAAYFWPVASAVGFGIFSALQFSGAGILPTLGASMIGALVALPLGIVLGFLAQSTGTVILTSSGPWTAAQRSTSLRIAFSLATAVVVTIPVLLITAWFANLVSIPGLSAIFCVALVASFSYFPSENR